MDKKNSTYYRKLKDYKIIMVFGTSTVGLSEMRYVGNVEKTLNIKFTKYYLVGDKKYIKSSNGINGIAVKYIGEIPDNYKKEGLVLIGRYPQSNVESMEMLKKAGFANIGLGVCQMCEMDILNPEELSMLEMAYGKDLLLSVKESDKRASAQIYAVTSHMNFHQTSDTWQSDYIQYIQAGAALTDKRVCSITDDIGDNISEKNAMYNETSAGYWIAKNDVKHDYVGLYHYSRGLELSDKQIQCVCEGDRCSTAASGSNEL